MPPGDAEVECPNCGLVVMNTHFCANCGYDLSQLNMEVVEHTNPFDESDSKLLDKLLYNVRRGCARRPEDGPGTVRALGDIIGLPSDYQGTVYSTGNIVFASEPCSEFTLSYHDGQRERFRRPYSFKKALIMKRVANEGYITVQTDTDSYRVTESELDRFTIRMISRTPIVVVKEGGSCYMMCENVNGGYISCQDECMDDKTIWKVRRGEEYSISRGWSFSIRFN